MELRHFIKSSFLLVPFVNNHEKAESMSRTVGHWIHLNLNVHPNNIRLNADGMVFFDLHNNAGEKVSQPNAPILGVHIDNKINNI